MSTVVFIHNGLLAALQEGRKDTELALYSLRSSAFFDVEVRDRVVAIAVMRV